MSGIAMAAASMTALQAAPAVAATTTVSRPIKPLYGDISPFYGDISAFYGDISPFYGKISPFYGKISPFYGDISAFYGDISPFTTSSNASINALYLNSNQDPWWGSKSPYSGSPGPYGKYATINPFWQTEYANWLTAWKAWQDAKTDTDYQNVATLLQKTVIDPANTFWGSSVKPAKTTVAAIAANTLGDANVTFTNGLIDASSLANASQSEQAMFFLNFYDQLMAYSGTSHVDWWMGSAHWSPALAEIATSSITPKAPVTIGMLDFTADPNGKSTGKGSIQQFGSNIYSDGHGAAVEGLIAGSRDGTGIMGVLPSTSANIVAYNPYDSSNTTNWTDIGTGYATLVASQLKVNGNFLNPAAVVNASLGVPGYTLHPDWNTVFSGNLLLSLGVAHNTILVVAAGNDGSTQTVNVPWNFNINPTLLVVGSVGVDGTISNFSNRPGTACLVQTNFFGGAGTGCTATLASRFIVAPGELVLVSDNQGNISRQTGTSLAAPLVTGAIGLLYARWPWLTNYAGETADIILKSATKLGTNPGNDPVYGAGELNIAASQSPLSWSSLTYYPVINGKRALLPVSAASVANTVSSGSQASWNTQGLYFVALESVGRTYRDFQIPLSSKLVGQKVASDGGNALFQSYLNTSLQAWVAGGAKLVDSDVQRSGMSSFMATSTAGGQVAGMQLRMKMTPSTTAYGFRSDNAPYNTDVALMGESTTLRFGYGDGAGAVDSFGAFAEKADHNAQRGGANPLLGLASGGAFVDYRVNVGHGAALNLGVTQRRDIRDTSAFSIAEPGLALGAAVYEASAFHVGVDMAVGPHLVMHTAMTQLHENTGLLGLQSTDKAELGKGSDTTGLTLGFDMALPHELTLSASGTMARTTTQGGQALQIAPGGLQSSAAEVALTKADLFAPQDRFRLTLSKSMQVDRGQVQYATYGVVDRDTGELGIINQAVNANGGHVPVSAELMYGRLLPKSRSEVSFYVRAAQNEYDAPVGKPTTFAAGGKFKVAF